MNEGEMYCPICSRVIVAENKAEVLTGIDEGHIFVHDDIPHPEDFATSPEDLAAMHAGVQ